MTDSAWWSRAGSYKSSLAPLHFHTFDLFPNENQISAYNECNVAWWSYGSGEAAGVKQCLQGGTVRHVNWCVRDATRLDGDGNENQITQRECSACILQDKWCMHQFGGNIMHLHFTEGFSHFLVFRLFHKISDCSFWCCLISFVFTLPCSSLSFAEF